MTDGPAFNTSSDQRLSREVAEGLVESTFLRSVRYFDKIESTNDAAISAPLHADELPALFITPQQTAGRGRGSNRWLSSDGGLTCSLVIDPASLSTDVASWPQLSLWTALGIRDGIATLVPQSDVQVKWPNDVFLQQRKVCGILIETTQAGPRPSRLVVGIGLNVNNRFDEPITEHNVAQVASPLLPEAISISEVGGSVSIVNAIETVFHHITEAWQLFRDGRSLRLAWQPHCLLYGRSVRWERRAESVVGTCCGISDEGALLLSHPEQSAPIKCIGGTISFLGPIVLSTLLCFQTSEFLRGATVLPWWQ